MKKSYIISLCAAALLTTACSKEDPFGPESYGEGQFLKSALAVDLNADGYEYRNTRAEADVDDFTVIFNREGSAQPVAKYRYGDMPEIVTLPAGTYTCTATYGENRVAEWESPFFLGTSEEFEVKAYEITSYVEPIVCNLENIKVTIGFDDSLRSHMSDDSYVEVKVGSSSVLNFGLAEADAEKAGYFMHSDETTLVAVFHGKVDGSEIIETKSMNDIRKGSHYKITFKLHNGSDSDVSGSINGTLAVDASVEVIDVNRDIVIGEDDLLDDSERPSEGEDNNPGGENPGNPGDGGDDTKIAPTITAEAPVDLEIVNDGNSLSSCVLLIHSSAPGGITGMTCDIDSPKLTPEELGQLNLAQHIDLVNTPDSMQEGLRNLGFPVCVGGQKDVRFEISPLFIGMLGGLGAAEHHFTITVTDANGTCTKVLKIKYTD